MVDEAIRTHPRPSCSVLPLPSHALPADLLGPPPPPPPPPQQTPPLILTAAELAAYDGSDPAKPLLLGINGTIYDVSSNQRVYGPDGSYNVFTGVDGGRGYVTGCFGEDRTADMRGAELMFLPLDDPAVDRHWPAAELAALRARERDEALRQVHDKLKHWVDFFAKSKKYHRVGYVKRPTGWPETEGPVRPLCEQAQQQREKRKVPGQEEEPQE